MTALPRSRKQRRPEGPCESYMGNLCGGMGSTETVCDFCHWGMSEHTEPLRSTILKAIAENPDYVIELTTLEQFTQQVLSEEQYIGLNEIDG